MKLALKEEHKKDIKKLASMLRFFCNETHFCERHFFIMPSYPGNLDVRLCKYCSDFLKHAIVKRFLCPLNPKPMCHECETHCYAPKYRKLARDVMRYWVEHKTVISELT